MNTEITISRIFDHLKGLNRPIASRRRSGVDERVMVEDMASRGLQCHADFLEAYRLCDGTETLEGDPLDQIQIFPGYYWMCLEEALEAYDVLVRDEHWNRSWFPIFASGGGDFYSVICDKESKDFGGIVGFILGESDHLVEFESMASFLNTIERSFKEGAFFVTDGYLEANYSHMRSIAKIVQPHFLSHDA